MIAIEITQVRSFMNQLLLGEAFDAFLVPEVSITTFATFQIDGTLHPAFYSGDTERDPADVPTEDQQRVSTVRWADIKKHCLSVIRGSRTPLAFHFVFQLDPASAAALIASEGLSAAPEEVHGLYLNCRFRQNTLQLTSGVSLAFFDKGKAVERAWDAHLTRFFRQIGV
ncbi:MAG: hypothetical protein IJ860_00745 [Eubacterium sp.]|nr:hypothetical protein [Eubacterium sp.]